MIGWLQSIDNSLFRLINASLGNPLFDRLMPFVSDSPVFACILLTVAALLIWRGGARGRICSLMLLLTLCLGNWMVCDSIKNSVARLRPFHVLFDTHLRIGMGGSFSMPSSHAANWFSAAMVLFIYYRRSGWIMFPMAALVAFSRVYNGVHYPSDVMAGALLGAGYSVAILWLVETFWQFIGPRWFPLWRARLPSLSQPLIFPARAEASGDRRLHDAQWLRLGYLLAAFLLLMRLVYLGADKIELSEDEAYQWLWSKHLALSYYSKPLLIAVTQFLGTHLWGDREFGVRFFSPVITFILSILLLRFIARETGGRTAFVLLVIMCACPLLALGSVVMTVDPLSVLFWTAAMITGWSAARPSGTTRQWLWTGLWMGLGLLSKYTNLYQFVCWAIFFTLWPAARVHLRRPGPWLAVLIVATCSLPIVIWNCQHNWITAAHVASDGQFGEKWHRTFTAEFLLTEAGVLNPIFFIGALWAAIGFWQKGRRDPWQLFLFSMGAPLFLMYFALSFHSRVLANWIAPAIVPTFALMAVYWRTMWKGHRAILRPCLCFGAGVGIFAVVLAHDTKLIDKLIHRRLPPRLDLLHRVHGWKETAQVVDEARRKIETPAQPAFIICEHYGFTSQISFYLPEAKSRVSNDPMVFYRVTPQPDNQFFYWPNYLGHTGQNAIFVREIERPKLRPGWFVRWWNHDEDLYVKEMPATVPPPPEITQEFESVKNLGIKNVVVNGDILRRVQLFECRNLR